MRPKNCDRISIIDSGHIIALDTPEKLKDVMGGDVVTLKNGRYNQAAAGELAGRNSVSHLISRMVLSPSASPVRVRNFCPG